MHRRDFLASASAAAAIAAIRPASALAQAGGPGPGAAAPADARLNALFDRIFADALDHSPELTTSLGLDKGARAAAATKLDDSSEQATRDDLARTKRWLGELERVADADLSPAARLNREIVLYQLRSQTVAPERFGIDSAIRPYRIFQQGGAYFSTPDFLNDTHRIADRADAEAYLARLGAFATALDEDTAVQRARAAQGYVAPAWSLDLTLGQMAKLRSPAAADSGLTRSLAARAAKAGIAGDWSAQAAGIVETQVYPALDRQIALVRELRGRTQPGDGVWRVPQGDAIYAAALAQATTTTLSPDAVHRMGLEQVRAISAQLDTILRGAGYTQGSVGARLTALNASPDQLYPDTPAGREQLIADLNRDAQAMAARLPRAFHRVPRAAMEIRAVPVEIQDGASNGYYRRAALDGSRPAIYYINLKDVRDWPRYTLPALTFHEATPGHHLQISLAQESADIPMLRKIGFFGAYSEGWALYAEQLADELDSYRSPIERAGYLQSFLFRAARLVVDTGLHAKRWTRERATDYLVETTGFARPRSQREVERYCTQGGQACSYKVGHMAWTRARADAEKRLGAKFDLKRFHDVLDAGAMPLVVMERLVAERAAATA